MPEQVRHDGWRVLRPIKSVILICSPTVGHQGNGSKPSATARSSHLGLSHSIRFFFQSRGHFLMRFSLAMAASIVSPISYQTRRLML